MTALIIMAENWSYKKKLLKNSRTKNDTNQN